MRWSEGFIAVDWGTTNRRAYRIDVDGYCQASMADDQGALSVPAGGFPLAVDSIRAELGDLPLLLAGMVGSTRGWVEVPYLTCPAGIDELAINLHWVEAGRIAIVPGLAVRGDQPDVMRGEEVQLFGAVAAGLITGDAIVCHPGTHNKWVSLVDGRVERFRTVMTGEMFNRLRDGGILSEFLTGEVAIGEAFLAGVKRGLTAPPLTAELFSIRARVLLDDLPRESATSFTSGLLIGIDVSVGAGLSAGSDIAIMGGPELTDLYYAAAGEAGKSATRIDGGQAFLAGALAIARTLQ